MAQTKVETISKNIQREKLSVKEVKSLIKIKHGVLDSTFSSEYLNDLYLLDDGRVIVFFDTHGYLYKSKSELKIWIDILNSKRRNNKPYHILKGKLLYGNDFELHVNELIDTLVNTLGLKNKKISLKQLKTFDNMIMAKKNSLLKNKYFFSGMVAYVGEIFIQQLPNAKWDVVKFDNDNQIWEPYIESNGKLYNPFYLVYTEIYEELPETNKTGIYDRVLNELNKKF